MLKCKDSSVRLHGPEKQMAQFLSMPLPQQCPADLRYALAKYDAQTILDAYEHLSELARAGLLEEGDNER
ncbi:unknown [Clostridium sp. CAG:448]|nr:unknown [Clostridium sp. CAG:448]